MAEERVNAAIAAKILGKSKSTICRWIRSGKIITPHKDELGYYYWTRAEFETYLSVDHEDKLRIFKNGH